jgi:hypothetical protein
MTAYIIVEAIVHDPAKFSAYAQKVPDIVAQYAANTWCWVESKNPSRAIGVHPAWSCTAGPPPNKPEPFGGAMNTLQPNHCGRAPASFG